MVLSLSISFKQYLSFSDSGEPIKKLYNLFHIFGKIL